MNARRIRALKLSRELMRDQLQRVAFDANLHEKYKSDCPVAVKAYKEREKLREAVAEIEKMLDEAQTHSPIIKKASRDRQSPRLQQTRLIENEN